MVTTLVSNNGYQDGPMSIAAVQNPEKLYIDQSDIIYITDSSILNVRAIDLNGSYQKKKNFFWICFSKSLK